MASSNSVDVLQDEDIEATIEADPLTHSIARILLTASLIGAPWAFGAVDCWAWMSLGLVASVVLFLWALGSVQQRMLKFFWSPLYIPLALFLVLALFQYGARLSIDRWETRTALILLAGNLTFFFVAAQLFGGASAETRRRFALAILFFSGVLGLFSILQFASGARQIYWSFNIGGSNFFGPYANADHYAGLMEMLIPVAAFSLAEVRRSIVALALPVLAVTIAVASLLLSGSRSGLLGLLVEVVAMIAVVRCHAQAVHRAGKQAQAIQGTVAAVVVACIIAAVLLFSWVDTGYVANRLEAVASPGNAWTEWSSFRKSVAFDSLHMLRDHPAFGIGLGNFETAYPQYQTLPSDLTVDYAHDDYAEAMAETGLVGTALILVALAFFFRLSFRALGERLRLGISWTQLGAAVGCCGLLVHSFFDFNLHIPANAAWFAVLSGIAVSDQTPPHSGDERHSTGHFHLNNLSKIFTSSHPARSKRPQDVVKRATKAT